ncbi:RNA polymerase sigma factor [Taibaiella koreensis]|uniref:RNA polymerase sigma factor n=1 Tax=Taibaiella koreensis TaxID=1268548 RepID=UPI0013C2B277|nr:RNA polymerase sigma factor [Taibaiella koreensis]
MKALLNSRPKYIRFATSILGNEQDAEDAVQDCYIRLWEQNRESSVRNLEAYMMQAVRNACLDRLRRRRPEQLDEGYWESKVQAPDVWQQIIDKDQVKQLQQLLQLLSEKQRTVFYLRDIEGYELSEIEGLMGISNEAVRAQLSRARKQLRELYNQRS